LLIAAWLLVPLSGHAGGLSQPLIYFVRHAEKAGDDPKDPSLSAAGEQRARDLATALVDAPPIAIFVSPYKRTQLTAAPIASAVGVEPTIVPINGDAQQYAQDVANAIEVLAQDGPILVVGHGNTIPPLIAAFGARAPEIGEQDYDRLFILRRWPDARVDLIQARYGAPDR